MPATEPHRSDGGSQALDVYLHGEHVGTVTRDTAGRGPSFQYLDEYRTRPGAIALGKQIPLGEGQADSRTVLRWIDALLPEDDRRASLAEQLSLHRMSTMSLIREVGLDCAGAVQLIPPGRGIETPKYEDTTAAEIALAFDDIARRPIHAFDRGARLSIAGAQEKLVLARRPGGGWAWPIGGAPSTHVLKPQVPRFPGLVRNEYLCMTVAARAGLPAAKVAVERFGPYETLVVERFDRTAGGERIHQEDFAQALGAAGKYQRHGGPSLRDCFAETGVGGWPLWDQVVFAWLIGDEDKHAKNFSITYRAHQPPRLAPVYDAVCTLAYAELDRGMAMRIGRAYHIREVDDRALRNEAAKCGLDPDEAIHRTRRLAERVRDAVVELRGEGWDTSILERPGSLERCSRACTWASS